MEDLVYELNFESAKIARKVCREFTEKNPEKPRFVAGSIGPTNKTASLSPDVNDPGFRAITFDELRIAYKQQAEALLDGGSDILLVETIFDTLNAKAALFAIDEIQEERKIQIPIMVSGTITDASGRTLSGQTAGAFLISISHLNLLSVGSVSYTHLDVYKRQPLKCYLGLAGCIDDLGEFKPLLIGKIRCIQQATRCPPTSEQ